MYLLLRRPSLSYAATSPRVTASHSNSEVKLGRVRVVLSSGRRWEGLMLHILYARHATTRGGGAIVFYRRFYSALRDDAIRARCVRVQTQRSGGRLAVLAELAASTIGAGLRTTWVSARRCPGTSRSPPSSSHNARERVSMEPRRRNSRWTPQRNNGAAHKSIAADARGLHERRAVSPSR